MKKLFMTIYYSLIYHLPNSRYIGFMNTVRVWYISKLLGITPWSNKTSIQNNVYLGSGSQVKIGKECKINENVFIQGAEIGDYVMIAPNTAILNSTHKFDRTDIPMCHQGAEKYTNPIIEDDVWIGRNVIIMPGVRIGKGSIIAAGSVVTKNIEEYSVMGGVPARIIRKRTDRD